MAAKKYHAKLCYHRRRLLLELFQLTSEFDGIDLPYLTKLLRYGYVRRTEINGDVIWSLSDKGRDWCTEARRIIDCK